MILNKNGSLCSSSIMQASETYEQAYVDAFVVMPNHIHLLIVITSDVNAKIGDRSLLSRFVGYIKTAITRGIHETKPHLKVWQRGYHDHVIRDEQDYLRFREYVESNPAKWAEGRYFL